MSNCSSCPCDSGEDRADRRVARQRDGRVGHAARGHACLDARCYSRQRRVRAEQVGTVGDGAVAERAVLARVARPEDDGVVEVRRPGELRLDEDAVEVGVLSGERRERKHAARHRLDDSRSRRIDDSCLPGRREGEVLLEETLGRVAVARADLRRQRAGPAVADDATQVDRGVPLVLFDRDRQPRRHVEARLVAGDPRQQRHAPRVGNREVQAAHHPDILVADVAQRDLPRLQVAVAADGRHGAGVAVVDVVDLAAIRREGISDGAGFPAHRRSELVVAGRAAAGEQIGGRRSCAGPGDSVDDAGEGVGAVEARERPRGPPRRAPPIPAARGSVRPGCRGPDRWPAIRRAAAAPAWCRGRRARPSNCWLGLPCRRFRRDRWPVSVAAGPAGCGPMMPRWSRCRES